MADGKVTIETDVDPSGAEKGVSKLGANLKKVGSVAAKGVVAGLAAVGTATVGAGVAMVNGAKQTAAYGDRVDKLSQKIGMSASSFQKWDFVLQQNGTSIDGLQMAMKTLSNAAQSNNKAFAQLGISQKELKNSSPEELFDKTISKLQDMESGTERTALASKLLGRSATELAPLLNQSAKDTEALKKQAEDYGLVMSDKAVKASAAFSDSLNLMQQTATGMKNRMMAEFLPALTQVTDGLGLLFKGDMSGVDKINEGISSVTDKVMELMPTVMQVSGNIIMSLANGIISNLPQLANQGLLIISQLANGILSALPQIFPVAVTLITSLTQTIISMLPQLLELGIQLLVELIKGITSSTPMLIDTIIDATLGLIDAILDNLPLILDAGLQLIIGLGEGLIKAIPKLLEKAPIIIDNVVQSLTKMIPILVETGIMLFTSLIQNLPTIIKSITSAIPTIVNSICDNLDTLVPLLVDAGVQLFIALVKNLPLIIATLIVAVGSIVTSIVSSLIKAIPKLADTGLTLLKSIGSKIGECASWIGGKMKEIVLAMKNAIVNKVKEFKTIGKNIVDGVWEGIKGMKDKITKNVKNFFGGIVDGVKKTLKIHSPSRIFRDEIGKMMAEGVIVGIKSKYGKAKKTASQLATLMYEAAKSKLDYFTKYNDLSLANEVSYWAKIVSSTKKGTQGYKDAMLEYKNAKNELNTQLKQAEQDYANKVSNVKESLIKDIQAVTDAYDSAVTKRKESILGSMDLFKEFTSEADNTSETLLTNLQGQVNALAEWDLMLDNIANRGVDTKFVEELQAMGPSVLADLKQINAMTDEQLNQYVELWNRKSQLAEGRAVEELEGYRQECESQIEQLIKDANANLNQLEKDFNATLKSLGVSTSDKSVSIGKSIVKGLKEGIQSQQSELDAFLNTFFGNITARAQNALSSITGAFNSAVNASANSGNSKLNNTIHNSSVVNNQTINVNQKVSTPDEIVRAVRLEERYA